MMRIFRVYAPLSLFLLFSWFSLSRAQVWVDREDRVRGIVPFEKASAEFQQWCKTRVPQKSDGFKPVSRALWFTQFRLDKSGEFEPGALWKEWERLSGIEEDTTAGTRFMSVRWQSLGPKYIRDYYSGGMGRINAIAEMPGDTNTIYIGSASGGVWVTHDVGQNWKVLTDHLPVLGVTDILIRPDQPSTLYLATGDPDSPVPTIYGAGILRSDDGGETWDTTGFGPSMKLNKINGLVMHPNDPDRLFAATTIGLWASEDGGDSWELLASKAFRDLDVSSDGTLWYATVSGNGLWRSTDDCVTWTKCTLPDMVEKTGRWEVAISPSNPDIAYVAVADDGQTFVGLWRTDDRGDHWTLMSNEPNIFHWGLYASIPGGQTFYNLAMAVDPEDPDHLFVGAVNLYTSYDAGVSWEVSASRMPVYRGGRMHADIHAVQYFGNHLYAGHDGGISINRNDGQGWTDISGGLVITQVHRLGLSQQGQEPELLLTGNQDNGINLMRLGEWSLAQSGDGMECAIDENDPGLMFAEGAAGHLFRSFDGGQTWKGANEGLEGEAGAWVAPFELHPDSAGILWRATGRIFVSRDSAQTWQPLTDPLDGTLMTELAISPRDPLIQAAAAYDGDVHYTIDGWKSRKSLPFPGKTVLSLAFAPDSIGVSTLYASVGGFRDDMGLLRWRIGVSSGWENISTGLPQVPINDLFIHPLVHNWFFAATDLGVYASNDRGAHWHRYGVGLPNVIITEINWHQRSNQLVVSSYGRGIWTTAANPVKGYKLPARNLTAERNDTLRTVTLKWDRPNQYENLLGYQVRQIGRSRVRVPRINNYTFTLSRYGTFSFAVDAVYTNGLSESSDTVTVRLVDPYPEPEAVVAFVDEAVGKASLQWYPPVNSNGEFTYKYGDGREKSFRLAGFGLQVFYLLHEDLTVDAISSCVKQISSYGSPAIGWHVDLVDTLSPTAAGERVSEGLHRPQSTGYMGWVTNTINRQVKGGPTHYLRVTVPLYYLDDTYEFGVESTDVSGMAFHRYRDGNEFRWEPLEGVAPMCRLVCSPITSVTSGGAGDSGDGSEDNVPGFLSAAASGDGPARTADDQTTAAYGARFFEIGQGNRRLARTSGFTYDFVYGHAGYQGLQVRAVYSTGASKWVDAKVQFVDEEGNVLSAETPNLHQPKAYSLSPVYPNPFNHLARATLTLPEPSVVRLLVYNVRGDLVHQADYGTLGAGTRTLIWNAENVASGTYIIEVRAGRFREAKKVMLIR